MIQIDAHEQRSAPEPLHCGALANVIDLRLSRSATGRLKHGQETRSGNNCAISGAC
jgi:hypothetical protein